MAFSKKDMSFSAVIIGIVAIGTGATLLVNHNDDGQKQWGVGLTSGGSALFLSGILGLLWGCCEVDKEELQPLSTTRKFFNSVKKNNSDQEVVSFDDKHASIALQV